MSYPEAMFVGLIQGVTELFPVSSLGHNVLIPALIGGRWAQDLNVSASESPYLAYIVGLHVATALAMIAYFWRDWVRILSGFVSSVRERQAVTADQRLAWMIILATIPVGIAGLALEHTFRVVFSKPIPTAVFLSVNGLILLGAEETRRRRRPSGEHSADHSADGVSADGVSADELRVAQSAPEGGSRHTKAEGTGTTATAVLPATRERETDEAVLADRRLAGMSYLKAVGIGAMQVLALLPGISRDGIVTVTGMARGLSREDAVRYSFLLSAPVILAAGVLKIPDLFGPLGNGIHGQVLAGSLLSGVSAYLSVRFLVRYFSKERSTLTPFGIYCLGAGLGSLAYLVLH